MIDSTAEGVLHGTCLLIAIQLIQHQLVILILNKNEVVLWSLIAYFKAQNIDIEMPCHIDIPYR